MRFPAPATLWEILRRTPDLTTEEGRSRDRYRRILLTAIASAAAKAITILAALVTVPLTLHYLGVERYGIWAVISSFSMVLAFADMGLGNGLVNEIAAAHGRDDRGAIRTLVSSGYVALGSVALVILALFALAYPVFAWSRLFNVTDSRAVAEAGPALAVYMVCFALAIPLGFVQKVQLALQRGFEASLWQCGGAILLVVCLIAAIRAGAPLPWLVAALAGAPLVAAGLNTAWFFRREGADIRPAFARVSRRAMRGAAVLGLKFFVLQLVASFAYGLDPAIIAQVAGAAAVAAYAVPERMFAIVSLLLGIAMQPLWPAYGEAIARGHKAWVRQTLIRSVLVAAIGSALAVGLLVVFGPALLRLWVGPAITAPLLLLIGLAAWKVIEAIGMTLAVYMNGAGHLGFQIIVSILSGVAMLAAKILLVREIGIAGIPWGAAIPFLLLALLPTLAYIRRKLA